VKFVRTFLNLISVYFVKTSYYICNTNYIYTYIRVNLHKNLNIYIYVFIYKVINIYFGILVIL